MPVAEPAPPSSRLGRAQVLTRAADWWHHKVPVVLAAAYVVVLGAGARPPLPVGEAVRLLGAFLVAVVGVAALGHVVNDLFDAEQDRRAGRRRRAGDLAGSRRALVLVVLVALTLAPWVVLPARPLTWALLGLELALLVGYSTPPVRAKERGALALVVDAGYAYVVPLALTVATFAGAAVGPVDDLGTTFAVGLVWALAVGLRGIAFHQIDDLEADRAGGVRTWAAARGREAALRRVTPVALAEPVLFAVLVVMLAGRLPLLPLWVALAVGWRAFQLRFLAGYEASVRHLDREAKLRRLGFEVLNDLYERWVPVFVLVTLAVREPGYWVLVVVHTIVFDNGLVGFLTRDLRQLPSFRYTWAYWSTYWRGRGRGERVRTRRVLRSPDPRSEEGVGRWVFVVCGPAEHVQTLHTALAWLRPRTRQEIVVVTDPARNAVAVDHDRVVEVATPPELDDKGASIWMKTSLHRHVPLDRTCCYLDTDVLAVRDDVDEVFGLLEGPVRFAPDRMIRDNGVDRFSPAAMTCEHSGLGDESSCAHLREALLDRWGLEVPGAWMNWNGGVFLFGPGAVGFLDEWHAKVLEAFSDDRFATRDQHALIATVWSRGLQDQPCLPAGFNTIVDLGNTDVTWWGGTAYAVHPDERPPEAHLLHLYCNDLHDPTFDLRADVEEVVLRQMARRAASQVRDVGHEVREVAGGAVAGLRAAGRATGRGLGRSILWVLTQVERRPRQLWWAMMRAVVVPAVDVLRRAGRSVRRRLRVLLGREASPGGRLDAVRFPKGWREQRTTAGEVAAYYDDWHDRYVEGFGDVLQTFRSRDPATFLLELADLAGMTAGMRTLDAGCGVGGPAMLYAAQRGVEVDAVTVSGVQADDARRRVAERGLAERVRVHQGDFHRLEDLFPEGTFDLVFFLEALCHTDHPETVLASVHRVLRPGGVVFIKDLYRNRGQSPEEEADIAVAVRNTEHHCHLNVWPRTRVLDALSATGFTVELDQPFPLFPDFDYDTGNDFVNDNGVDIFEGRPSTYLEHAAIRARRP